MGIDDIGISNPVKHTKELRQAVVWLYKQGYAEKDIISLRQEISQRHKLGSAWLSLSQSTANRWLKAARDADPDLEIWHLVNRRRWKPGIYTHWKAEGQIILMPFYDSIRDKMYLGAGGGFFPLGSSRKVETVKLPEVIEQERLFQEEREKALEGVGPPVPTILRASFGYSYRDIEKLSQGKRSRFPDRDKAPEVQQLVKRLESMSYSTIRRIILSYDRQRLESGVTKVRSTKVFNAFTGETVEDWTDQ